MDIFFFGSGVEGVGQDEELWWKTRTWVRQRSKSNFQWWIALDTNSLQCIRGDAERKAPRRKKNFIADDMNFCIVTIRGTKSTCQGPVGSEGVVR